MTTTVLFDLDGTLLPLDQDRFINEYFKSLANYMAQYGYEPKLFAKTIYDCCMLMLANDGKETNEKVFWHGFTKVYGEGSLEDIPYFNEYYRTAFQSLKAICGFNPAARETVYRLKQAGIRVILATNPVFPAAATEARIRWAGLEHTDFEAYTTYENSYRCKPSKEYYADVLNKAGVRPEECIMVGNDVSDDMPAKELGMRVFLLTDCLINRKNVDISRYEHGSYYQLNQYLDQICR